MSKREIKVEVLQCDQKDNDGERCKNEGVREAIKECGICHKDICITHYELTTVTIQGTRDHFTYYFCSLHTDEFMETLVEKFGDTKPVPRAGYGITFN